MLEEVKKYGKNLLDLGVIIGYNSNYLLNVVLFFKFDRFFLYWNENVKFKNEKWLLYVIDFDDIFDIGILKWVKCFIKLYMRFGYW